MTHRIALFLLLPLIVAGRLDAAPIATLSLEPNPSIPAGPGETVDFQVWLHDYQPEVAGDPILSFGLNVAASDPALTGGGADYSGFNFTLNPALNGTIGGGPGNGDMSNDGKIDISADIPLESGITDSDVLLGSLTVVAPGLGGSYVVDFQVDPTNSISAGTFLVLDDGTGFPTLPEDGDLTVVPSTIVVPEASALWLACCGLIVPVCRRQ